MSFRAERASLASSVTCCRLSSRRRAFLLTAAMETLENMDEYLDRHHEVLMQLNAFLPTMNEEARPGFTYGLRQIILLEDRLRRSVSRANGAVYSAEQGFSRSA